jgi:hypothetical protein
MNNRTWLMRLYSLIPKHAKTSFREKASCHGAIVIFFPARYSTFLAAYISITL